MVWVRGATRAVRTRVMRIGRTTSNQLQMLTGRSSPGLCAVMFVLGAFAACLVLQMVDSADHYELNLKFGLRPGTFKVCLTSFPRFSSSLVESLRGKRPLSARRRILRCMPGYWQAAAVTAVVLVTSSLAWWLFGPLDTYSVGASGVICGWIGYGLVGVGGFKG